MEPESDGGRRTPPPAPRPFQLTRAVQLIGEGQRHPQAGYCSTYVRHGNEWMPMLVAIVSAEDLLGVFRAACGLGGSVVDVVVETSHELAMDCFGDTEYVCHAMDARVLASILTEFEELLVHDGYTSVRVLRSGACLPQVRLTAQKFLALYHTHIEYFEHVLLDLGIPLTPELPLYWQHPHQRLTSVRYTQAVADLIDRLGATRIRC